MSLSKLKSGNSEQSENGRGPSGSRSVPIGCRVCDRVFFDNLSLVLHFECHVKDGFRLRGRDLASLRSGKQSSSSWSPYSRSSLAGMNEAQHVVLSRMNGHSRPRPLPVDRTPTDPNLLCVPVMNAMPPMNPSFEAQLNVPQPTHHSTMSRYGATSSSASPLMYSQLGARNIACGSAMAPHLQLRDQNGGQTRFPDYKNAPISRLEQPNQDIIVLSDDEEKGNKSTTGIDLTLKL